MNDLNYFDISVLRLAVFASLYIPIQYTYDACIKYISKETKMFYGCRTSINARVFGMTNTKHSNTKMGHIVLSVLIVLD
jgi:hypothetical protein